jgi:hypothetical protein
MKKIIIWIVAAIPSVFYLYIFLFLDHPSYPYVPESPFKEGLDNFFYSGAMILSSVVPVAILLSVVWFLFNLVRYFIYKNRKDDNKKQLAKKDTFNSIGTTLLLLLAFAIATVESNTFDKPVVYLYPTKTEQVNIKLNFNGKIIADYPKYDNESGWTVTAYPDGKIINQDGKEYSYLFWEGQSHKKKTFDLSTGFVVKGEETREFLEEILPKFGFTPKEYNEFIVYWYPILQNNKYNLIHFATDEYVDEVELNITPKPDSVLRVFMAYKPVSRYAEIKPQEIKGFNRHGFVVVEWGGAEVK